MHVPSLILEHAEAIRAIEVDEQAVPFKRDSWRSKIPDFDDIISELPGDTISRREIFRRFSGIPPQLVPCDAAVQAELKKLFVWSMLWGYGVRGYGATRVAKMLATPNLGQILCRVSVECYYGVFLKAYDTLNSQVQNLGPAFATKFLYFLSAPLGHSIKPLIFDSVVVETLRTLDWPDWCPDFVAKGTSPLRASGAYGQYLIWLHNWAFHLRCRPDQLEYFLWRQSI